ncbi:MAG TPA: DsbA family oxidoreductase [Anaerolineales bacterium]|nr:DsbA family oxidoreductase [Anaerolineales bacterium]HRF46261.1 DsbA family oxidoreductase [Anaerolineales bacterium]
MPSISVAVFSDYVCPWCFMGMAGLDAVARTHTVLVSRRAYELRPREAPPRDPAQEAALRAKILSSRKMVEEAARDRFGLEMRHPELDFGIDTRLAHVGARVAEALGAGEAYHRAVFAAYWQQGRNIGERAVLREIASEVGLEAIAFDAALDRPEHLEAVLSDETWAQHQGLGGVPAFIFANRYLVSGAQPVAVLRQVVERCVAEGLGA